VTGLSPFQSPTRPEWIGDFTIQTASVPGTTIWHTINVARNKPHRRLYPVAGIPTNSGLSAHQLSYRLDFYLSGQSVFTLPGAYGAASGTVSYGFGAAPFGSNALTYGLAPDALRLVDFIGDALTVLPLHLEIECDKITFTSLGYVNDASITFFTGLGCLSQA
jgi:hypothetical protein